MLPFNKQKAFLQRNAMFAILPLYISVPEFLKMELFEAIGHS